MESSQSISPISSPDSVSAHRSLLRTPTSSDESDDLKTTSRRTHQPSSNKARGCLGGLFSKSLSRFSHFGHFVTKKSQRTNTVVPQPIQFGTPITAARLDLQHDASKPVDQPSLIKMMENLHELSLEQLVALKQSFAPSVGVSQSPKAKAADPPSPAPSSSSSSSLPSFAKTSQMHPPFVPFVPFVSDEASEIQVVHKSPAVVAAMPSPAISLRPLRLLRLLGRLPDIEQSRRYYGENEEQASALMDSNSEARKVIERFERQRAMSDQDDKQAFRQKFTACLSALENAVSKFGDEQINTHFEKLERLEGEANERLAALKNEQSQAPTDQVSAAVKSWETQLFCVAENKKMMMAMFKQIELNNFYKNEIDKQLSEINIDIGIDKQRYLNVSQPVTSLFNERSLSWL